jgi:hypothetical protein
VESPPADDLEAAGSGMSDTILRLRQRHLVERERELTRRLRQATSETEQQSILAEKQRIQEQKRRTQGLAPARSANA